MKKKHVFFGQKILAVFISLAMIFSSLGVTAFAEETLTELSELKDRQNRIF